MKNLAVFICFICFDFGTSNNYSSFIKDPGLSKPLMSSSKWEEKENCDMLPSGWHRIAENSKYVFHDDFKPKSQSVETVKRFCEDEKFQFNLPGIAHLADWIAIQTFLQDKLTDKDKREDVIALGEMFNEVKRHWYNIYTNRQPFGFWINAEPNLWEQNTLNLWIQLREGKLVTGLDDIEGNKAESHRPLCQFPYTSVCYTTSKEEKEAKEKDYYNDEINFIGESKKYNWYIGTQQRSYEMAKFYCQIKGLKVWDNTTIINAEEENELEELVYTYYTEKMEGIGEKRTVLIGRMDFNYGENGNSNNTCSRGTGVCGVRKSWRLFDCSAGNPKGCFTNQNVRSFTPNFVMCLEEQSGPFNTEGL